MLDISGFTLAECIYSLHGISVYRVDRDGGLPGFIKLIHSGEEELEARGQREYALLRELKANGVLKATSLNRSSAGLYMVFEGFPGLTLTDYLTHNRPSGITLLKIALQLAGILTEVHAGGVIHKNLQPGVILIRPDTLELKLTGFDHAELAVRERKVLDKPGQSQGDLHYTSPEQTGRMGRGIDFRSDLYSLGVIYYELATGRPPFSARPLELIHMHLAVEPEPPDQIIELPGFFSSVVMKLLEKQPEKRYQTAGGLHADLATCRSSLDHETEITDYPLGTHEVPYSLELPDRLFGRDRELERLENAYRRVLEGKTELVIIEGKAGMGKTILVNALRKLLRETNTRIVEGRFDQFQSHIPYTALIQAFNGWVEQIMTGTDEALNNWRRKLRRALRNVGPAVVDLIPKLKLVLGDMDAMAILGPGEARNRVSLALLRFVKAITSGDNPIMLHLDDLQWADTASLAFLEAIMDLGDETHLLIVATVRESSKQNEASWKVSVEKIAESSGSTDIIQIGPWRDSDTHLFVAECLKRTPMDTTTLAELITRKTGNIPLFVRQYIRHAYTLGHFFYDTSLGWQWDYQGLESAGIPDDIAGLLTRKITSLPKHTREVLELAGCVGRKFDPKMLLALSTIEEEDLVLYLHVLTGEGLIVPSGKNYQFTHNRIYETAISLMSEKDRAAVHSKIGDLLLGETTGKEHSLFEIVDHLNRGIPFATTLEKKLQITEMNLVAGRKAMSSGGYDTAEAYFQQALRLCKGASWQEHYRLKFDLLLESAQGTYLIGDFQTAMQRLSQLLDEDLTELDRARVIARMVSLNTLTGNSAEALALGLSGLARLGVVVPAKPSTLQLAWHHRQVKRRFTKHEDRFLDRPMSQDESFRAKMAILSEVIIPSLFTNTRQSIYLAFEMMRQFMDHGRHHFSPMVLSIFGCTMGVVGSSFEDRAHYGHLAASLDEQIGPNRYSHRVRLINAVMLHPWLKPYRQCTDTLEANIELALEEGDPQYATYSANCRLHLLFLAGKHLGHLARTAQRYADFIDRLGYKEMSLGCLTMARICRFLSGGTEGGPLSPEDPFNLAVLKDQTIRILFYFYAPHAGLAFYIMGRYEDAYALAEQVQNKMSQTVAGGQPMAENIFILGLSAAALAAKAKSTQRRGYMKTIEKCQQYLSDWSAFCAANFSPRRYLIQAELARLRGSHASAFHLYALGSSKATAENCGFLGAIIEERRAGLAMETGLVTDAATYLTNAIKGYLSWGAEAKIARLKADFVEYLPESAGNPSDASGEIRYPEGALDLDTVVRGSLAISQEVELDKVLQRVMAGAIENAGAQRGVLLLHRAGRLWVEAQGNVSGAFSRISAKPFPTDDLPVSTINYAQRTRETVNLQDAYQKGLFREDPYVLATRARSILVLPILNQNKLVGILYLENNLLSNAFPNDRLEILRLIAAQAAVSIENASLYNQLSMLNRNLETRVEDRTKELQKANDLLTQEVTERISYQKKLVQLQSQLMETAHRAGKAELAIDVLHNVANVLNSVTTSVESIDEDLKNSKLPGLGKAVMLLEEHAHDLGTFITEDEHGRKLPSYLASLAKRLKTEQTRIKQEIKNLIRHLSYAIEVIRAQQDHAKSKALLEPMMTDVMLDNALELSLGSERPKNLQITRNYQPLPVFLLDKNRVKQILLNLIQNALEALVDSAQPTMELGLRYQNSRVIFTVGDNGAGIEATDLTHIFSFGFTTRGPSRDGFGLHNAANAAAEMGGSLKAHSDGQGAGSLFTLSLPLREYEAEKTLPGFDTEEDPMRTNRSN